MLNSALGEPKDLDAAVKKAYGGKKKIVWMEMFAGEKSCKVYGENVWLPEETLQPEKLTIGN